MSDAKIPPTFKGLLPFIRRAEELDRDATRPESKLIAYFCRQYAMELGIKLRENDNSNEATNYLLALMDRLEEDKAKLPTFSQEEGKEICEEFALEIFTKADDEDRAGCADKNTARTFYAAGTFLDILNQFGDVSDEIQEKRRYCKYKAATILKALKEGQIPTPGPPGEGYGMTDGVGEDGSGASGAGQPAPMSTPQLPAAPTTAGIMPNFAALSVSPPPPSPPVASAPPPPTSPSPTAFPSFTSSAGIGAPMNGISGSPQSSNWSPSAPAPVQAAPVPVPFTPSPPPPAAPSRPLVPAIVVPPPAPTHTPYVPQTVPMRNHGAPISQNEINDAMECAKFAIAALKVKDIDLAIQRLEMALQSIR